MSDVDWLDGRGMSWTAHEEWWRPAAGSSAEVRSVSPAAPAYGTADSAVPFWALMAFTFILLVAPQSFLPALAPFRIALLAASVAVGGHLLHRFLHGRPFMKVTREMWVVAVLVGWAILTIPLSYWPGGSVSFLLDLYFKSVVVFWLIANVVNTVPRLRIVLWGVSLMAIPLAATAVGNFLSGDFMNVSEGPATAVRRIVGYDAPLTENPNDLALMLNLVLPLSIALFLATRRPGIRAVLLGLVFLDVAAIVTTYSRTGFLTLAVIIATYMWALATRGQGKAVSLVVVIMIASVPFLPSSYVDRLSTITNIESDSTGSAQERLAGTLAAMSYVTRHPIMGAGVGNNVLAMNEARGPAWKEIHNVYLQYAVELGLPGVLLFVTLLVMCIRTARRVQDQAIQCAERGELSYFAEGIRISLIAFCVAALFQPSGYNFYFYYMAGLALAARECVSARASVADPARHPEVERA